MKKENLLLIGAVAALIYINRQEWDGSVEVSVPSQIQMTQDPVGGKAGFADTLDNKSWIDTAGDLYNTTKDFIVEWWAK